MKLFGTGCLSPRFFLTHWEYKTSFVHTWISYHIYKPTKPAPSPGLLSSFLFSHNPYEQLVLNCIFFHHSDNCCDKSYISNYNNSLPQCWSSAFLGDRNKICLPGSSQGCEQTQNSWRASGPAGQATLRKALLLYTESKHLTQRPSSSSLKDWEQLSSLSLGWIN